MNEKKISLLFEAIAHEHEAIAEYIELLPHLNKDEKEIVEEIIADENNHAERLRAIADKYYCILEVNS